MTLAVDIHIATATESDARELAANLRPIEREEVTAATGRDVEAVVLESVAMSQDCYAVRFDGALACIFGVVAIEEYTDARIGAVWMLTTAEVERRPVAFVKLCRRLLPALAAEWDALVNAIYAKHAQAVRWAKHLGIELEPARPFGAHDEDFHLFTILRGHQCVSQ